MPRTTGRAEAVHQLQAVADGDVADRPALGCEDGGDLIPRGIGSRLPERLGVAQPGQCREPVRVACPGQFGDQMPGRARDDQPVQAGPDHVSADQRQHAAAEDAMVMCGFLASAAGRAQPPGRQQPPAGVPRGVRAAGDPPFLPGAPGLLLEPVQDPDQPEPAGRLTARLCQRERRAQQPGLHLAASRLGRRPRRWHLASRELLQPPGARRAGEAGPASSPAWPQPASRSSRPARP